MQNKKSNEKKAFSQHSAESKFRSSTISAYGHSKNGGDVVCLDGARKRQEGALEKELERKIIERFVKEANEYDW